MRQSAASPNAAAPPPLRALLDGIDALSRLDGWMGAACLVALTALMLAEVAVRALSNVFPWVPADIPVAWEYSSYLMAATFTFGAAMTLRAGGHIRVTLVLARISPQARRWLETLLAVITMFVVLFAFLAGGLWIGWTLAATGTILLALFRDIPLDKLLAQYAWNILTTQELLALPMFILMGEILFRTRLSQTLFNGLVPWAGLLPGRLLHVNVIGCTIFAAISGSSAATTQVVGRISLSELLKRGYSKDVAVGSLAGAGTLGFLIPPSNILIIYGVLGDVSIAKLFTAGFIPGVLLAGCFMGWIMIHTVLKPGLVPEKERAARKATTGEYLASIRELGPAVFLILCVLGSMYGGLATPSESAGVGVLGALVVASLQRALSISALRAILIGAVQTCAMIALIVIGASILGSAAAFLGIPGAVAEFVSSLGLSPFMLILALIVFYLILGCFLDGFSMIVMTLPIVMPIVKAAGFDVIWFGIFLVLVVEMAQITPPVGFNLFVIQGLTEDGLGYIARVTLPYLLIMVGFTMMITLLPDIALWLPRYLAS